MEVYDNLSQTLAEYLNNEVKQEIGFDKDGEPIEVSAEHTSILRQKYGLMAPILTEQETNWIKRLEGKKHGK